MCWFVPNFPGSADQEQDLISLRNKEKRGKTEATKFRLFLDLQLIGWESHGASFLDQSHSERK